MRSRHVPGEGCVVLWGRGLCVGESVLYFGKYVFVRGRILDFVCPCICHSFSVLFP
jgi:hypothetical protein